MPMRLQEVHPTLVHYPLAFFPLAILSDLLGSLSGSRPLKTAGRRLMPLAAVSAAVTGAAGLIAQQSVRTTPQAMRVLHRHRTLNLSLIAAGTVMTFIRMRRENPGAGYLAAGLGALAAMSYSAYLGGKLVYEHGTGVRAAGGLIEGEAPEVRPGTLQQTGRVSMHHLVHGARHAFRDITQGLQPQRLQ